MFSKAFYVCYIIVTSVTFILAVVALVKSFWSEHKADKQKTLLARNAYLRNSSMYERFSRYAFLCWGILTFLMVTFLTGCSSFDTTTSMPNIVNDAEVGAEDAELACSTDCGCDLNYCPRFLDPSRGRYKISYYREIFWDDGDYHEEKVYPCFDDEGCILDVHGGFSVVSHRKIFLLDYFWYYEGMFSGKFTMTRYCPDSVETEELPFSYWYWNLCQPGYFFCGFRFYEEWGMETGEDEEVGSALYEWTEAGEMTMLLAIPGLPFTKPDQDFYSLHHLLLEGAGDVGDCDDGQFHCYLRKDCSLLLADCVDTIEECAEFGGLSYSQHRPEHKGEWCFNMDEVVK